MTTKIDSIIAVDSDVGAGAATWWRLTTVEYQPFIDGLKALAWPDRLMPSRLGNESALKRSLDFDMKAAAKGRKLRVEPLNTPGAYAVEETVVSNNEVTHIPLFKVVCTETGLKFWEQHGDTDRKLANRVEDGFAAWRGKLDGYDLGMWLSNRVVPHLMGLTLRDRGGIYYIPPTTVPAYRQVANLITELGGGKVFELPAMECRSAVDAILDAVQQEALDAISKMEKDLEGDIGAVGLKNRATKCDRVLEKVTAYETMLGSTLDTLRQRTETLSATIAAAILTAQADADQADEEAAA